MERACYYSADHLAGQLVIDLCSADERDGDGGCGCQDMIQNIICVQ